MKVYDCFMYYDEDTVVDIRLNCLDPYVDKFIIVESKFTHSGKKRNLLFDINKFNQFKNKISYFVLDHEPGGFIFPLVIGGFGILRRFYVSMLFPHRLSASQRLSGRQGKTGFGNLLHFTIIYNH